MTQIPTGWSDGQILLTLQVEFFPYESQMVEQGPWRANPLCTPVQQVCLHHLLSRGSFRFSAHRGSDFLTEQHSSLPPLATPGRFWLLGQRRRASSCMLNAYSLSCFLLGQFLLCLNPTILVLLLAGWLRFSAPIDSPSRVNSGLCPPLCPTPSPTESEYGVIYYHWPNWNPHVIPHLLFDPSSCLSSFCCVFWRNFLSIDGCSIHWPFFFAMALHFFLSKGDHSLFIKMLRFFFFLKWDNK